MFKLDKETEKIKGKDILVSEPKVLECINNRIYFYSEIDRGNVLTLNRTIREMYNTHLWRQQANEIQLVEPIYLHINSNGGSIFAGLSSMDTILIASRKVDVITIIDGCCASAATFLSVVGTKRLINKHAYMLIHQLSSVMWGKFEEFKDEMSNLEKLMNMIKDIYRTYTRLPEDKLEEILKHDLWFNAKQCLEYGLVDEIII